MKLLNENGEFGNKNLEMPTLFLRWRRKSATLILIKPTTIMTDRKSRRQLNN